MKTEDIIVNLLNYLQVPVGRHLYGIIGEYITLSQFENKIKDTSVNIGKKFASPISINESIIDAFNDEDFRDLVNKEARRPEPTRTSIKNMFEKTIRSNLDQYSTIIIKGLELIFIYDIDFSILRTLATDNKRIILMLPGKRSFGRVIMYPNSKHDFSLPQNLIADSHLWEISQ
jgi:hypothetical protein